MQSVFVKCCKFRIWRHHLLEFEIINQISILLRTWSCSGTSKFISCLVDFFSLLRLQSRQRSLQNSCTSHLMVVAWSFCFQNILVASKCISVIHIAKFRNQCVHSDIIFKFLTINELCLLFDYVIKSCSVRQLELIINFELRCLNTFSLCWF